MQKRNEPVAATLLAHCGTQKISRAALATLPVPPGTRTHQPLSHLAIVEALSEALAYRYLKIRREEYAVSPDGMKMFGVLDLEFGFNGGCYSIGLRNSNDKSMRLGLTAGYRVFVCDNMAFAGEFSPLLHKHTQKLDLLDSISIAVDRIHRNFAPLKAQIKQWQDTVLTAEQAKLLIYEAFLERKLKGIPRHLLPLVHANYFRPSHEAFGGRTLWSLSNAFTSAFKQLKPLQQFAATAKLGAYLDGIELPPTQTAGKVLPFPPHPAANVPSDESDFNELAYDSAEVDEDFADPGDLDEQLYEDYEDDFTDDDFADVFDDETRANLTEEYQRKVA